MVEVEIDGVVKLVPEPKAVPPVAVLYQLKVPLEADACNVTLPESHRLAGVVDVIVGTELIVATTAVLDEVQPPTVAST